MALIKPIMTPKGIASFWILGTVWRDNFNKTAYITLYGYESLEHCDYQGAEYKDKRTYNIKPVDYDRFFNLKDLKTENKCDLDQYYKFIKGYDSDFAFAEDYIVERGD